MIVSDYDAVGGGPAVAAVVDDFYRRVLDDGPLAHHFKGVDMARLKRHQALLIDPGDGRAGGVQRPLTAGGTQAKASPTRIHRCGHAPL